MGVIKMSKKCEATLWNYFATECTR